MAIEPNVVTMPAVSTWSFTSTGTPCSGPDSRPMPGQLIIEPVGLTQGVLVDGEDGVERRAVAIVGLDPRQVTLDQCPHRQVTLHEGPMDVVDRCLDERDHRTAHGAPLPMFSQVCHSLATPATGIAHDRGRRTEAIWSLTSSPLRRRRPGGDWRQSRGRPMQ